VLGTLVALAVSAIRKGTGQKLTAIAGAGLNCKSANTSRSAVVLPRA